MERARHRLIFFVIVSCQLGMASPAEPPSTTESEKPRAWYERISLRGYAQLRYNRLFASNPNLVSDQGDKSIGDSNSLFLRRARLIFSGDITPRLSIYIQPDFASSPAAGVLHFLQIRDYYADIFLDSAKELRLRAGQSKVPFGFENLQSSQNRLPLDRDDAINSVAKDERELGLFFYWAPAEIRKRFKHLVDSGLKGSGDYGVVGFGVYNGQTANKSEANNNVHFVGRVTYPYELGNGQIVEASLQAYSGIFSVTRTTGVGGGNHFLDQRLAASLIVYPQPIGFQAEYTIGQGPELDFATSTVEQRQLRGGYVMASYKWGSLIPFVRWQFYLGGRKHEPNSPRQRVYETELGVEWQVMPALELTAMYVFSDRTSVKAPYVNEYGRLARLQLQWNY